MAFFRSLVTDVVKLRNGSWQRASVLFFGSMPKGGDA
jgi:hypothetical protein